MDDREFTNKTEGIKAIVSGTIGANPDVSADISKKNEIGVRTVNIVIEHEYPFYRHETEECRGLLGSKFQPIVVQVCDRLAAAGYSVTAKENLHYPPTDFMKAKVEIRCSLNQVNKKKEEPVMEEPPTKEEGPEKIDNIEVITPRRGTLDNPVEGAPTTWA